MLPFVDRSHGAAHDSASGCRFRSTMTLPRGKNLGDTVRPGGWGYASPQTPPIRLRLSRHGSLGYVVNMRRSVEVLGRVGVVCLVVAMAVSCTTPPTDTLTNSGVSTTPGSSASVVSQPPKNCRGPFPERSAYPPVPDSAVLMVPGEPTVVVMCVFYRMGESVTPRKVLHRPTAGNLVSALNGLRTSRTLGNDIVDSPAR